ncbi:MAG: hypothetical protein KKG47_09695 [Proteobacteria bacterium]|nr:hypothetical protein [Pseudomonadota bacterium]MBU1736546.1 hypothetical protein [Pseudomonadota bacterium]
METSVGPVPQVGSTLGWVDSLGLIRARMGFFRESYRISPGLYCVGEPDANSPVLVSANYKLTFDTLRGALAGQSVWILALDTRGVNVWCAAAHNTFGTAELVNRVRLTQLAKLVTHRKLIVPQLGAPGVSAAKVLKGCGFEVVWGPIRAADIRGFIAAGQKASPEMRKVSFALPERIVLSPVELTLSIKPALVALGVIFVLSGIGPDLFSPAVAWQRLWPAALSLLAGLLTGAVLVPIFLPWVPFRMFYLKGLLAALPVAAGIIALFEAGNPVEEAALFLLCLVVSSFAAMNYTGATPYASPSGVEKEMRSAIPVQILMILGAAGLWLTAPFL